MRTIYVIVAEKQYSSSKVLAAFDSEDAANKLKETIEAVEPRWTLEVQPIGLQTSALGGMLPPGFRVTHIGDGEPELFRPASNAEAATG